MAREIFPKFVKNRIFAIDSKVLNLHGFWPESMPNYRTVALFLTSILFIILPEFFFILKHINNVQMIFMCLHEFVSFFVYVIKCFSLLINREKTASLIENLRIEWIKCEILFEFIIYFYIHFLAIAFEEDNEFWRSEGEKLERVIYKATRFFYTSIFASGFIYFTLPVLIFFLFLNDGTNEIWPFPVQVQ
jgi:hypothetical protein